MRRDRKVGKRPSTRPRISCTRLRTEANDPGYETARAMTIGDAAYAPALRRRQRQINMIVSSTATAAAIAPLVNRPPGRSMVRDRSEGASPSRARRNATTLSPMVVPDSE